MQTTYRFYWVQSENSTDSTFEEHGVSEISAGAMAVTMKLMASMVALFGVVSFIIGVIAENKKPAAGTPIPGKDVVICKYPSDPTVVLGYLSVAFLIATTVAGYFSLFYPYKGKSVPQGAFFKSTSFVVFFNIAIFTAGLAGAMLLWPTITEQLHLSRNVHHNLNTDCPTAKTGLLGGGAFLSLDASLLWLVALMLADNAREDYFEETEKDVVSHELAKGSV
ncbi:keratin-associated protein [Fagus crenata]